MSGEVAKTRLWQPASRCTCLHAKQNQRLCRPASALTTVCLQAPTAKALKAADYDRLIQAAGRIWH